MAARAARKAIGADTIVLVAGTYSVTAGTFDITTDITLSGAGAQTTVIDGAGNGEAVLFSVNSATPFILQNMQITNVAGPSSGNGGVAYLNTAGATVTLYRCHVYSNTGRNGTGVFAMGNSGVYVIESLFEGNTADYGAGISAYSSANVFITNSTFYNNTANTEGGAIQNSSATIYLAHSTITANHAGNGGGFYSFGTGSPAHIVNTIIAGNTTGSSGPDCNNNGSSLVTHFGNVIGDTTNCLGFSAPADEIDVDPSLGAVGDNGGPTATAAPGPGSVAIGLGTCTDWDGNPVTVDQRGTPRLYSCTSGAFESVPVPGILISTSDVAPGADCTYGGVKIESGIDDDGDGILDADEVDNTDYACNGADGADGSNGTNGSNGTDGANGADGADGANGSDALIDVTAEPAGDNCPGGGQRIDVGVDDDNDGVLDAEEIDSTSYICNGANGADGIDGKKGGCSTGRHGSGSWLLIALIGLFVSRRRRSR